MRRLVVGIAAFGLAGGLFSSPASADSIEMTAGFLEVSRAPAATAYTSLAALPAPWFALRGTTPPGLARLLASPGCLVDCGPGGSIARGVQSSSPGGGRSMGNLGGGLGHAPRVGGFTRESSSARQVEFARKDKLSSLLKPSSGNRSSRNGRSGGSFLGGAPAATVFLPDVTFEPGTAVAGGAASSSGPNTAAPEPSTLLLLGAGLGGVMLRRARRARQSVSE